MGVKGLFTFLQETGGAAKVEFCVSSGVKQNAIVDGNALVHNQLLANRGSIPSLAAATVRFATHLAKVFSLTILFDGPLPRWKFQQRVTREKDKIRKLSNDQSDSILSPLSLIACIQSLCFCQDEGAFTVRVADGEADLTIADSARRSNAFIIGSDSDFFVHACPGYLPLDCLSLREDGGVSGLLWTNSIVAKALGIDPQMLPVLAYLAGCDYTIDDRQFQLVNVRLGQSATASKKIRAFANHLKPFTTVSEGIYSLLPKDCDPKDYATFIDEVTTIVHLFTGILAPSETNFKFPCLPNSIQFSEQVISAALKSHKFVEITNGTFWCQSVVEDLSRAPAWEISRPIRQKLYHLLNLLTVGEFIRRGTDYRVENVTAVALDSEMEAPDANASLSAYKQVMGYTPQSPSAISVKEAFVPFVCALRYLGKHLEGTAFQLKNFEYVALICMAIRSVSQPRSPSITPLSPFSRSKQTNHMLACLETILFSAWLVHQSQSNDIQFQHAHWNVLDVHLFCTFLMPAKTGRGPQHLLAEDEIKDFKVLWDTCCEGGSVVEVVDYGSLKGGWTMSRKAAGVQRNQSSKKIRKNCDDNAGRSGKKKLIDGQNLYSVLSDN